MRRKSYGALSRGGQWRARRRLTPPGQPLVSHSVAATEHDRQRRREIAWGRTGAESRSAWGRVGLGRSDFLAARDSLEFKREAASRNIMMRLGDRADPATVETSVSAMSSRQLDRAARASESELQGLAGRKGGRDRTGPWGVDRQGRPIVGNPWWYKGRGRLEAS